jgi:adenosine 3'-phospho 5'-phosphosulfate transporter B3
MKVMNPGICMFTGVLMISSALLCDAAIGNVQEKSMKLYKATNTEVVLYSYSIGFVYLFIVMLITGDLGRGMAFCSMVGRVNLRQYFGNRA